MNVYLKKVLLTLVTICMAQTSLATEIWQHRCQEASEATGVTYTMNAQQAQNVRSWLMRCAPRFKRDILKNKYMKRKNGDQVVEILLYPVLGKTEWVPDANAEGGEKPVYTNPLNYQINVAAVAENPSGHACDVPTDYEIIAYCGSGCFTPDQQVWFPQGDVAIGAAELLKLDTVVSVSTDSTFGNVGYQVSNLTPSMYIQTEEPQKEYVLTIMTNDKAVTVTRNHPMLMANGEMKRADEVIVGESLVNVDGEPEAVMAIEEGEFFGKVLNLETDEEQLQSHIIAAQGLLTGDFLIQNINMKNANRFLLRNSLFPVKLVK
ncbi:MAG: hypothetical protein HRT44_02475 [Bdellovibrionales bacterium]|nr:Hint domain-containing protein [Bdellovibrionales bacterium]NQZ18113.1 hypothetical protein [Bdellovibrionales bacterium]